MLFRSRHQRHPVFLTQHRPARLVMLGKNIDALTPQARGRETGPVLHGKHSLRQIIESHQQFPRRRKIVNLLLIPIPDYGFRIVRERGEGG